ncbi:arylsulfotransferase family protein [Halobellus limi]|uniref:Arylsulfotransferase (Asst) n=1 Tax=Halobellus limi TaxID=699433 RepID=A0A1H6CM08_9EURY|nr:arylsulfotransferase family protein [Halobellus limi]QCC48753.1 arylsulfotransferase (asst) [Halobellus limi]SEG73807.1 Arylsulfotransferase (ASST) [Halobellus limi]
MPSRRTVRGLFAALVLLSAATLVGGYVQAERTNDQVTGDPGVEQAFRSGDRSPVVAPRSNVTVVATDSNAFVTDENDAPRAQAELVAFAPDGSIHYYENRHTRYWDVDPISGTDATVEFVYADHLDASECGGDSVCTRNGVERVNLTTGERTDVFSRITPGKHSTRWHDVDRVDDERLLVADIARDRVFVANTTTGLTEWEWDAQSDFDVASGGPFPDDWTHLNDVEHVEIDGRDAVMVSLRNHDQVAFVDFERGLLENWTLGSDGDHDTLYEQHNPDYIPPEHGGPAVLVADSENSRIVEYQRANGSWERSWTWSDRRMQWARDADRLPNGHTLVTDSNGDRVFEIDTDGEIVWSATVGFPYESERLGTGDESAGGESAAPLGLSSRSPDLDDASVSDRLVAALPPKVVNGISYLLPRWVGALEGLAALVLLLSLPSWGLVEYRRSARTIELGSPIRFGRK